MKLTKKNNILLVGLSLILSLVSFTSVASVSPNKIIKTALIISDYSKNKRFSIQYHNVNKIDFDGFIKFSVYTFTKFQNNYDLKANTAFKIYAKKHLGLKQNNHRLSTTPYLLAKYFITISYNSFR